MNIDRLSLLQLPIPNEEGSPLTFWIDLSKEVNIEGRQVTSFPSLFGDISGLKDFFNFLILLLIGGAQAKMYHFNQLRTFFRYNARSESERPASVTDIAKSRDRFTKLKLTLIDKLKFSLYSFCLSRGSNKKKKVFEKGLSQLENALDTRSIIRNQRALRILLSFSLSKTSRKLIHLQRRTTVLDLKSQKRVTNDSSTTSVDEGVDSDQETKILRKIV